MSASTQLSEDMQTTCLHCGSVFHITTEQVDMAQGQVRCNQCMQVFNALLTLENFSGQNHDENDAGFFSENAQSSGIPIETETTLIGANAQTVSLNEAMYGDDYKPYNNFKPVIWMTGILLLIIMMVVQLVYYQRYPLISSTQYQQQILNLCRILPCDKTRFSSLSQIKLIERNVFTHPTREHALMITGSLINEARFKQSIPELMISLSNVRGELIANRLFTGDEYLTDKSIQTLPPGKVIQFRLEVMDPDADALTYEFEFVT